MNLELYIREVLKRKKIALMTHAVIGYPSVNETYQIVHDMAAGGADIIELQIPFSDPLADGPVIMQANDQALKLGVTVKECFKVMSTLSPEVRVPLLFMGYYQTVFAYGVKKFCHDASQAGATGLIIPDVPLDEESHEGFIAACDKYGLNHIRLLSPTSTDNRILANAKLQNGFVYCTSKAGTTGAAQELDSQLKDFLAKVKMSIHTPVAVGFGISKAEHLKSLVGHAEMAVVGSAVISVINEKGTASVKPYLKELTKLL